MQNVFGMGTVLSSFRQAFSLIPILDIFSGNIFPVCQREARARKTKQKKTGTERKGRKWKGKGAMQCMEIYFKSQPVCLEKTGFLKPMHGDCLESRTPPSLSPNSRQGWNYVFSRTLANGKRYNLLEAQLLQARWLKRGVWTSSKF